MSTNPMVFIDTAPQPTAPAANPGPVLLVDPPGPEVVAVGDPPADAPTTGVPRTLPTTRTEAAPVGRRELESAFRAPTLAIVAAVAIIAGYRWLGMIPTGSSRLSSLVFDRTGVVILAVVMAVVILAVTRPAAHGRRLWHHRLAVLASLVVMTASVVLAWLPAAGTRHGLGVCDLALASALAGVLVIDERRRRQAESSDRLRSSTAGTTNRSLPVS
jgi:hypothetical protein